jgi:hypothetical protein
MLACAAVRVIDAITFAVVGASLGLLPAVAGAQDAGARDASAEPTPESLVAAVRGGRVPALVNARRTRQAATESLHPRLERGRCYELVGAAQGAAQVRAQVRVRDAVEGPALPLANSQGAAARRRFCVAESPELYRVDVEAWSAAWWHLEVLPLDERLSTARVVVDAGVEAAPAEGSAARFPPGSGGTDYVSGQLRQVAARRPGTLGLTAMARHTLATNGMIEQAVTLPSNRCVEVAAAAVPSVGDLVIELEDPTRHRVAQDSTHRGTESARFCTRYSGLYRYRVRVFAGAGEVAVQVLIDP